MRVALHAAGEVGTRTGRILLAERSLTALGLYGRSGKTEDRRMMAIHDLEGFDLLVTDDPTPGPIAALAVDEGIPCVTAFQPRGRSLPRLFAAVGATLLTNADLAEGIAATLAAHETARGDASATVIIACTVEGRPLRRGVAVPFPDPVGARWARRRPRRRGRRSAVTRLEAPVPGPWAGALARISGALPHGPDEVIVGVADHGPHLAAIALAAGAIAVAEGAFSPGARRPSDAPGPYLAAALRVGLAVATYSSNGTR